jgi:hypothetical protein
MELKLTTPVAVTEQAAVEVEYVTGWPDVAVASGTGGALVKGVLGRAGKVIVLVPPETIRFTVCGVAAAKFPAAGCVTRTEHVPLAMVVMMPVELTEQTAGVVGAYVGGTPEVVVAPIGTFVPTVAVVGTVGGMVIVSVSGVTW